MQASSTLNCRSSTFLWAKKYTLSHQMFLQIFRILHVLQWKSITIQSISLIINVTFFPLPADSSAPLYLCLQSPRVSAAGPTWLPSPVCTSKMCNKRVVTIMTFTWRWQNGYWPVPGPVWAAPALAAPLRHDLWLVPLPSSPGPARPRAARCAAASPSGPPAEPWCLRSSVRTEQTSLWAGRLLTGIISNNI